MANPQPGTTIGPYEIEGAIGAGSMGDVFKGVDTSLKRKVAVKILSEKHRESPELRARFVREGRAVAAISHPNVVQVFTTGTFDERPFIAMEFLDGIDFGTMVDESGPLSNLTAAKMILDAARGLEAAARAGLIHRDVKPSNLVRLTDGRVKVTDFGLAKPVDPGTEPALTALGVVVGTPDYIAPEQARGDAIDERVDIYALGGTLYFLLVGTPPFRTGKPAEDKYLKVVARHLRQAPPDARTARPEVDDELAELVRAMMAKKPSERPDYAALIRQLEGIVVRLERSPSATTSLTASKSDIGRQTAKTPFVGGAEPHGFRDEPAAAAAPAPGPAPTDAAPIGGTAPARRSVPMWLVAVTVLSALVLVAGIVVAMTGGGGDPARGSASATDAPPGVVPAGMVMVKKADGSPWFLVDRAPVDHGDFAAVFPDEKKPSPALDEQPVTSVAYNFARAYAASVHKRLLTGDEYAAALATPGVAAPPAGDWEWVDAGDDTSDKKPVRAPGGKSGTRAQGGDKDVTFRCALDLK